MSHELNDQQLLSAYMDGELTAAERTAIESMLAEAGELRQLLEDWKNQQSELRSLPLKKMEKDISRTVLQSIESSQNQKVSKSIPGRRLLAPIATIAALLLIVMLLNIPAVYQQLGWFDAAQKAELAANIPSSIVNEIRPPEIAEKDQAETEPLFLSNAITVKEDQQLMIQQRQRMQTESPSNQVDQNPEQNSEPMVMALPSRSIPQASPQTQIDSSQQILFVDISNQIEGLKRVEEVLKTNQIQITSDNKKQTKQADLSSSTSDLDRQFAGRMKQEQIDEEELMEVDRPAIAEFQSAYAAGIEVILIVAKQSQVDQVIDQLKQHAKIVSFNDADVSHFSKGNDQSKIFDRGSADVMGRFRGFMMNKENQANPQTGEVAMEKISEVEEAAKSQLTGMGSTGMGGMGMGGMGGMGVRGGGDGIGGGLGGGIGVRDVPGNAAGNASGIQEEQAGQQQSPNEWVKILLLIKVADHPDP